MKRKHLSILAAVILTSVLWHYLSSKTYHTILHATFPVTSNIEALINKRLGSIDTSDKKNLLLDFGHSRIFVSNDMNKLKHAGYPVSSWEKIPFEVIPVGIVLHINTDLGLKRFAIDTRSTLNLIRPSYLKDKKRRKDKAGLPYFTSFTFMVGKKDFGRTKLHLYDTAQEPEEIDGLLGEPFLKKHAIYLDFEKQLVYVAKK